MVCAELFLQWFEGGSMVILVLHLESSRRHFTGQRTEAMGAHVPT